MKNLVKTVLIFLLIVSVISISIFLYNSNARKIENGADVPEDIARHSYVLANLTYDQALAGYPILLKNIPQDETLVLTLYFRIAQIWQNGEILADLSQDSASQRTFSLPIHPDSAGRAELLLKTAPSTIEGYSLKTLFSRYTEQKPKIVLGTESNTQHSSAAGNVFYHVLIGAYIMLIASCLVMYRRKTSEKYLLSVCAAAFFVLLYLLSALESKTIFFPYGIASKLSAMTNVLPVTCLAYTCTGFFPEAIPKRFEKYFSLPAFVVITFATVLLDMFFDIYTYQFVRRIMLIPVLITLSGALAMRLPGSRMIFTAYSCMEGITLFLYISNSVLDMEYSPLLMFIRIKEVSNLILVSACAYQIFNRFSSKFLEADHLAAEVTALNISLEHKVQERTKQLVQEQQSKRAMMLNIFHDLRSPIFVLKGRLSTMHADSQEEKESLEVMSQRIRYLERLVEDLFLLAKLENDDIQYDQDYVDISALAHTVFLSLQSMAEEKGVHLHLHKPNTEAITTWGDAFRIQQAIVNLVENAVLYTPAGGRVSIQTQKAQDKCLILIADTGKGIPAKEQARVFERFYRTDSHNRRSSGLGLSIAHEIIVHHLGDILIESEPGKGSLFTVVLPYCETEEGAV